MGLLSPTYECAACGILAHKKVCRQARLLMRKLLHTNQLLFMLFYPLAVLVLFDFCCWFGIIQCIGLMLGTCAGPVDTSMEEKIAVYENQVRSRRRAQWYLFVFVF